MSVRVLVADDQPPARAGVRRALEGHGFLVCAEADDVESAVAAAERERPDLCLLEVDLPGNGLAAAAAIATAQPATAIVMLTASDDDEDVLAALRVGASGYLLKDFDPARLPAALHAVLAGEGVLSGRLVARLIEEFRARGRRRLLPVAGRTGVELTDREWEVAQLLRRGLGTKGIAERLVVAPTTIRSHVSAIVAKLGVESRADAIALLEASTKLDARWAARPMSPAPRVPTTPL